MVMQVSQSAGVAGGGDVLLGRFGVALELGRPCAQGAFAHAVVDDEFGMRRHRARSRNESALVVGPGTLSTVRTSSWQGQHRHGLGFLDLGFQVGVTIHVRLRIPPQLCLAAMRPCAVVRVVPVHDGVGEKPN